MVFPLSAYCLKEFSGAARMMKTLQELPALPNNCVLVGCELVRMRVRVRACVCLLVAGLRQLLC